MHPREAGLQQRTVIVEFDSYETALTAHESEAYKKALRALGSGAERDFRIVEGYERAEISDSQRDRTVQQGLNLSTVIHV